LKIRRVLISGREAVGDVDVAQDLRIGCGAGFAGDRLIRLWCWPSSGLDRAGA